MNITEYINYFEELADKHKFVPHSITQKAFFANDIPEVLSGLKIDNPKNPFVVLNTYNGKVEENKSQITHYIKECSFLILQHVPLNDWRKLGEVKATTEQICFDFISKMLKDKNDTSSPCHELVASLSNISISGIADILDGCFGWVVEFDLNHQIDLTYKANNWI